MTVGWEFDIIQHLICMSEIWKTNYVLMKSEKYNFAKILQKISIKHKYGERVSKLPLQAIDHQPGKANKNLVEIIFNF